MLDRKIQPSSTTSKAPVLSQGDPEKVGVQGTEHVAAKEEITAGNSDLKSTNFDDLDDPENPLNWSKTYKWTIIWLISLMTLTVNFGTLMCAPAAPLILSDFKSHNSSALTLLVSIWELGEAFGPLLVAPLSEMYGRAPIYHTANVLFIIFSVAGAVSSNLNMLIAFRFLTGISVASVALNPSIVGDLFAIEQRGGVMSIMGLLTLLGPVTGPIIGGYLSQGAGWRWKFWLVVIMAGVLEMGFVLFYRETYKVKILDKKANRLRKQTGNNAITSAYNRKTTAAAFLRQALVRPIRMLFLSPMVLALAVYGALVFGYLYLVFTTLTPVLQDTYKFSTGAVSLAFLGIGIGMAMGMLVCRAVLDWYSRKKKHEGGGTKPEHRLPPMIAGGVLLPIGLFLYGWTAQTQMHWMAPIVGAGILGFGIAVTIIPTFSYLVDAFGIHAASAIAGDISLRCVTGAVLPLAGPPLYSRLGLGWGNSVLGFIALIFLPVPLVLMRFGERIRASSMWQVTF